jgi:predicted O-methyltransferase YrrM
MMDFPKVLRQAAWRRRFNRRPVLPWIPYPVIRRLSRLMKADWRIMEWGSGMSTIWFAERVQEICSVESDMSWYDRIRPQLPQGGHRYRYVDITREASCYWGIQAHDEAAYDLAFVDGLFRKECMQSGIRAVRPGGPMYLDNIDTAGGTAFCVLQEAVARRRGTVLLFTGFPPGQPTVTTGALARI